MQRAKARLDALELKAEGTHIPLSALEGDTLSKTIDFHQAIGCKFLVVPSDRSFTDPEVARLKSSADLVKAIEAAVRFYEEPPAKGMTAEAVSVPVRDAASVRKGPYGAASPAG